jgi:hypothetical protein
MKGPSDSQGNFMVGKTVDPSTERVLKLKAGSVLAISGTDEGTNKHILVVVVDTSAGPGVIGETGARIVLGKYGYIGLYDSTNTTAWLTSTDSLAHNFYDNGSSKITTNGLCNKTYERDADLNSGDGGWKADSYSASTCKVLTMRIKSWPRSAPAGDENAARFHPCLNPVLVERSAGGDRAPPYGGCACPLGAQ